MPNPTLREVLIGYIDKDEKPEKAIAAVNKIAKQTSLNNQVSYLSGSLDVVFVQQLARGEDTTKVAELRNQIDETARLVAQQQEIINSLKNKTKITADQRRSYEVARYKLDVLKSQLNQYRAEAYDYIEKNLSIDSDWRKAVADPEPNWWKLVERATFRGLGVSDHTNTAILDRPVQMLPAKPKTKVELSEHLSRDMNDYLFVKDKGGGAKRPGEFGGEYVCLYATENDKHELDLDLQRMLIKKDTAGNKHNIAEFVASEILTEIIDDGAASVFYLRSPWNKQGVPHTPQQMKASDATGDNTYVVSVFFDGFTDLYKDLYARDKIPKINIFYNGIQNLVAAENDFKALGNPELDILIDQLKAIYDEDKKRERAPELFYLLEKIYATFPDFAHKSKIYEEHLVPAWTSIKDAYEKIMEEPPEDRPKFLATPVRATTPFQKKKGFNEIFKDNIYDPPAPGSAPDEAKTYCLYDNYEGPTAGSLLIKDFDAHSANYGPTPGSAGAPIDEVTGKPRKELKRIDFGAGLHNLKDEIHMHSHSRHLPLIGPTNHIREWPRPLRINLKFAKELEREGNYPREKLMARINRAIDKTAEQYGTKPFADFAEYIGFDVSKFASLHDFNFKTDIPSAKEAAFKEALVKATRNYLTDRMLARQLSMKNLAMEIRLSVFAKRPPGVKGLFTLERNAELDKLIKANPNYFTRGEFHVRGREQIWFKIPGWNKKKLFYLRAIQNYAGDVLKQKNALCPIMKKDFTCDGSADRAYLFLLRMKIMANLETDPDRKAELLEKVQRLREAILKYNKHRGEIENTLREDTTARQLTVRCDESYQLIQRSYTELVSDPEKKRQIEEFMDGGKDRNLRKFSQLKTYTETLEKQVTASAEFIHNQEVEALKKKDAAAGAAPGASGSPPAAPVASPVPRAHVIEAEHYDVKTVIEESQKLIAKAEVVTQAAERFLRVYADYLEMLAKLQKSTMGAPTAEVQLEIREMRKKGFFQDKKTSLGDDAGAKASSPPGSSHSL
ncbi:MAG TPA: hypothetical protein VLI69_01225 [Gammaproteobacteria bacterium]|nr:hypothetical protein [Gammaproteobacteria bacterium]